MNFYKTDKKDSPLTDNNVNGFFCAMIKLTKEEYLNYLEVLIESTQLILERGADTLQIGNILYDVYQVPLNLFVHRMMIELDPEWTYEKDLVCLDLSARYCNSDDFLDELSHCYKIGNSLIVIFKDENNVS